MKTLLTTVAALLIAGPAIAFNDLDQGQLQGQLAIGAGGSAKTGDNSNPQTTGVTQEGDHYDGSLGFGYADAPMPSSPVVSPGSVNFPQHTETWKVLGPLFGHSYTGGAGCINSGAVATALLYRDAWLLAVQHYGVTAAAPAQAEYAKTLEAAGKACSE